MLLVTCIEEDWERVRWGEQGRKLKLNELEAGWGCSSVCTATDWHTSDTGSIPRECGNGFFAKSQYSVTRTVSLHPRVQPHALRSVRTLKIL